MSKYDTTEYKISDKSRADSEVLVARQKKARIFFVTRPMLLQWLGLIGLILILSAIFSYFKPSFASAANIQSMLIQLSISAIVAFGVGLNMISGGLDISVGSMAALGAMLPAWLMVNIGLNPILAIVVCIMAGITVGFINGILHTKFDVNPLVVTLGMLSLLRGLTNYIGKYLEIPIYSNLIIGLGSGKIGPIPVPFIIALVVFAAIYFVQTRTKIGRLIYASGANPLSSFLSGIRIDRVRIGTYIVSSVLAATAGLILAGRSYAAYSVAGLGWELDAVGAVVIGGIALSGGRGSVVGTVIGVVLMGVASNALLLMGFQFQMQLIIKGAIVIIAIILDSQIRRLLLKRV